MEALFESSLHSIPLVQKGKVRDIYAVDDDHLLIVTTDRLSAFDVILPDPVPGKGAMLTALSLFWFDRMASIIENHLVARPLDEFLTAQECEQVQSRAVVVRKLKPLPIEAVARGYLIGSGWKDYQDSSAVCGIALPEGLAQGTMLPEPIFAPATKAAVGDHDENIDFQTACGMVGPALAEQVRDLTLKIYREAAAYAQTKGIIIADTKFEFGLDDAGSLVLIDEILTSDSSRFWPADEYRVGISPPSFDKQFVRDYLETLDWDKRAPGPHLPQDIIDKTAAKYAEALTRLTS